MQQDIKEVKCARQNHLRVKLKVELSKYHLTKALKYFDLEIIRILSLIM